MSLAIARFCSLRQFAGLLAPGRAATTGHAKRRCGGAEPMARCGRIAPLPRTSLVAMPVVGRLIGTLRERGGFDPLDAWLRCSAAQLSLQPKRMTTVNARLLPDKVAPDAYKALAALQAYVNKSGLEPDLLELVKLRASQINGCAWCIDMHTQNARVAGETEQRLYLLSVWRECPFYTARERAALAWTEAVTSIAAGVPDDVFEMAVAEFGEDGLVKLNMAIIAINSWNRMNVAFRVPPGDYKPPARRAAD
jgi:AhpD family alkylhydroperoxidase